MKPKAVSFVIVLVTVLTGCGPRRRAQPTQRFVIIPNPSQINKDIPAGALALDTKTGQLCYTVGGDFTSEFPRMDMCTRLYEDKTD
jgi:hypothetical protein